MFGIITENGAFGTWTNPIQNAVLAAMLIGVGYKLANPNEFGHMAKIGIEQISWTCYF